MYVTDDIYYDNVNNNNKDTRDDDIDHLLLSPHPLDNISTLPFFSHRLESCTLLLRKPCLTIVMQNLSKPKIPTPHLDTTPLQQ